MLGHAAPDFFIIGVQKGGTTSLYNYLARHPHVLPATEKEIHYFTDNYSRGDAWYRTRFPARYHKIRRMLESRARILTGEATPYYIFHPHAARRIQARYPHASIILMLRNPVERAYSHYRYHVKLGVEKLSFEDAIAAEPKRLTGELEKMMTDENYSSEAYKLFSYLRRGIYIEQIRRWREYFPREQMLVLKSEDFFSDPAACFLEVTQFLRLERHDLSSYDAFNAGAESTLRPDTRQRLVEYFRPCNEQLYDYLGVDFGWD
ncbi:MAG: sulfotransferase domain-containing protein [Gammaproteobacteria bacterium]|nr:sulfotransferase domain-containing protein [Gammaproteobacteria bacterium]